MYRATGHDISVSSEYHTTVHQGDKSNEGELILGDLADRLDSESVRMADTAGLWVRLVVGYKRVTGVMGYFVFVMFIRLMFSRHKGQIGTH